LSARERAAKKEQIDGGGGRTFEGVQEVNEQFTSLEKGKDYLLIETNPEVKTEKKLEDYFIFINPSNGTETRKVTPPHWRTVTTPGFKGEVELESGKKDVFFEANTKGVGYLKPSSMGDSLDEVYDTWIKKEEGEGEHLYNEKILGLADVESFKEVKDDDDLMQKTMHLARAGLRVEVYWGVAALIKAVYRGELVPIDDLREKGVIPKRRRFEPAMAVRLFKTNSRIEEAYRDSERRVPLFKRAFQTFNEEEKAKNPEHPELLHIGNVEDEEKFFKTFAGRLGKNLAVLMNEGFYSLALHSSNITLAAEIADAESFKHHSKETEPTLREKYSGVRYGHIKDARDLAYDLRFLTKAGRDAGLHTSKRVELCAAFMESFLASLDKESLKTQGTDPEKAIEWVSKIFTAVITERQRLPSLRHYAMEEWPISVE